MYTILGHREILRIRFLPIECWHLVGEVLAYMCAVEVKRFAECTLLSTISRNTKKYAHAHFTAQPTANPPNVPTPRQSDLPQSIIPSFALQLCSFSWPTAADAMMKLKTLNIYYGNVGTL